jgi:hypothetical protein
MKKVGFALVILLFLVTLNSTYFFLSVSKVRVIEWLVFNACAPSSIAYLIGFVLFLGTKSRMWLHIAIPCLLFFGGLGLFLFPWSGYNLIAQFSHIVMVSNVLWVLYGSFKAADYKAGFVGLLVGIVLSTPFIGFQQTYVSSHPEAMKKILGVGNDDFQQRFNIGQETLNDKSKE